MGNSETPNPKPKSRNPPNTKDIKKFDTHSENHTKRRNNIRFHANIDTKTHPNANADTNTNTNTSTSTDSDSNSNRNSDSNSGSNANTTAGTNTIVNTVLKEFK